MRRVLSLSLLLALCGLVTNPARAADPAALDAYRAELARVESATEPTSLEPLLAHAEAVQEALIAIADPAGSDSVIETYSEPDYAVLQQRLRGLHLQRGMEIYVQPQPDFFLVLAEKHGRVADVEFFRLYRNYWGRRLFPIYMEPRALVVGCVNYGDGLLTELYEDWQRYSRRHPGAYSITVVQMLRDFEEVVSLGTCACGDRDSVIRELRGFIKRFPDNPAVPAATKRWRELKMGREQLPLSCG